MSNSVNIFELIGVAIIL